MARPRRYQDLGRSAFWLAHGLHPEAAKLLRLPDNDMGRG
jgi:hypothetical protein